MKFKLLSKREEYIHEKIVDINYYNLCGLVAELLQAPEYCRR
jgi:hypothetical protein